MVLLANCFSFGSCDGRKDAVRRLRRGREHLVESARGARLYLVIRDHKSNNVACGSAVRPETCFNPFLGIETVEARSTSA